MSIRCIRPLAWCDGEITGRASLSDSAAVSPRRCPPLSEPAVEVGWPELPPSGQRVVGQLPEHDASPKAIQIDAHEVRVGTEPLGDVEHLRKCTGPLDVHAAWTPILDLEPLPVGRVQVTGVCLKPTEIHLDHAYASMKDKELVVKWHLTSVVEELLNENP